MHSGAKGAFPPQFYKLHTAQNLNLTLATRKTINNLNVHQ
jgi:hypothetical protein